jgi:hypothetical protein
MSLARTLITTLALAAGGTALAQDRAEVAPSQIIGNRELPKVIYIVPWKKPAPDALKGRPPVSVLDEVLAPVERDVFRRQLAYGAAPDTAKPQPEPVTTKANTAPAAKP